MQRLVREEFQAWGWERGHCGKMWRQRHVRRWTDSQLTPDLGSCSSRRHTPSMPRSSRHQRQQPWPAESPESTSLPFKISFHLLAGVWNSTNMEWNVWGMPALTGQRTVCSSESLTSWWLKTFVHSESYLFHLASAEVNGVYFKPR